MAFRSHAIGRECWTPEPIWRGATAFCLGGGPSLDAAQADRVRSRHVIAINSSYRLAPWAPVLFFTDAAWWLQHREAVAAWPGLVVTSSRRAKEELGAKARRVESVVRDGFPPVGSPVIRQGRSSGHTAVALAIALGAVRAVLLGYDMRLVDGRSHHHDDHACDAAIFKRQFLPGWAGWRADATAVGVEILNATPGSALAEFPLAELDDVMEREAA